MLVILSQKNISFEFLCNSFFFNDSESHCSYGLVSESETLNRNFW